MKVTLWGPGGCVSCMGLYDSGNLLKVPGSEEPIHIIAPALLHRLLGQEKAGCVREESVAFRALGTGEGTLKVYRIGALEARQGKCCCRMEPAWVGCGDEVLMRGKSYQIILNAGVMDTLDNGRASGGNVPKERREICLKSLRK